MTKNLKNGENLIMARPGILAISDILITN